MTMKREQITPKDEAHWLQLRTQDITSTDCAALVGFSPYATKFETWHHKRDSVYVDIPDNERMAWGRHLEAGIAHGAAEDFGWSVEPMKDYYRLPDVRVGSSFDFQITKAENEDGRGTLEIKNVDYLQFQQGWVLDKDGILQAPPHIELQLQHQMLVSGYKYGIIAALVSGNRLKTIRREADEEVHALILDRAEQFWRSIESDDPPPPIFPPDNAFIRKLYGYARTAKEIDLSDNQEVWDLCQEYKDASADEQAAKKLKETARSKLLMVIDDAEKARAGLFTISAGMIGPAHIEYDRKPYRNFRVSKRKEKK